MPKLNPGEGNRMNLPGAPSMDLQINRRTRLAYRLALIYLALAAFFVGLNYLTGQWVLGHVNLGTGVCYLLALGLISKGRILTGKSLISIGAIGNAFLVTSVLGKETGNYLWYFPTASVVFLLFSPEKKHFLFIHLTLLVASLILLELTDYNWLSSYSESAPVHKDFTTNLFICLFTIGLCMYYSQKVNQQIEADLQYSENKLNTVLNSLDEIVWVASLPDKKLLYVNDAVEKIYGYSKEAILDNFNWFDVIHPDDQEAIKSSLPKMLQEGTFVREYRIIKPDGTVRWLSERCKVIENTEGTPVQVEGTTIDMTERKLAELALKESEANLYAVLENTSDLIWSIDTQLRLVTFNSTFQRRISRLFNTEVKKGGSNINSLPPAMRGPWREMYAYALAGNSLQKEMKFEFPQETIYAELSANPIRDITGAVTGASFFAKDITARKKQERELQESQARFKAFMDNSPTAAWITDQKGRIIYLSKTYSDMFRMPVSAQHALGKQVDEIFDTQYAQTYLNTIRKVAETGHVVETIEKRLSANGNEGDFLVYKFPIPDVDGRDVVGGVAIDITESKLSQEKLRFHSSILAQVSDAVIGLDNWFRVNFWNKGAEQMYGWRAEEALGKKLNELYGWEWIQPGEEEQTFKELYSKGSCKAQMIHILSGGKRIYIATTTEVWRDENGKQIGLLAVNRDITESKLAEETIRQNNHKLTALLENSQNIIFAVDCQLRYIAFNHLHQEIIRELYGIDIELGMSLLNFPADIPADRRQVFLSLNRALKGEQFILIDSYGSSQSKNRHFEHAFTPMRDEDGQIIGVTVFSLDITERVEAEEELKRINFELDSFVYRSSHDLRAPLMSVLGLIDLVRVEEDIQRRDNFLMLMEKSIRKLDTFITDMTNFSRNTRQQVKVIPVDFNAIIAECADNLRYMQYADRVSLRIDVQGESVFFSDPQRINTVFQNLMSNSVKYQRLHISDAYIHFDIQCNEKEVRIIYRDNGQGIEQAYLDQIFDMFFRASAESYGSGLGLYITRQVVRKLNGTIAVESQLGQGTTFTIILPNLKPEAMVTID